MFVAFLDKLFFIMDGGKLGPYLIPNEESSKEPGAGGMNNECRHDVYAINAQSCSIPLGNVN